MMVGLAGQCWGWVELGVGGVGGSGDGVGLGSVSGGD